MTKNTLQKEWEAQVNEFKRSKKTQATWCKENSIHPRKFSYWYLKFKNEISPKESPSINWLPVSLEKLKSSTLKIKIGCAVIEVTHDFDGKLLSDVVKALGAIC